MNPYSFDSFDRFRYGLMFGMGTRHHAIIRPDPGVLPAPLEQAANAMHDARTDDEVKAASREFLLLSEEWADR